MKRTLTILTLILAAGLSSRAQNGAVGDLTASSTDCTTTNACIQSDIPQTMGGATIKLKGTWSATAQFEVNSDVDSVTPANRVWVSMLFTPSNSSTQASFATANGEWQANISAYKRVRVRISAYSSGTTNATINFGIPSARGGSGGGGSSGTVNSGTAGQLSYYATTGTAVSGDAALTDLTNTLTYSGSGGITASAGPLTSSSDGVHAGQVSLIGNTTAPSTPANSFQINGPLSAAFTSITLQTPTTAPGNVVTGLGITPGDGWLLQNTTSAGAGAQQVSPSLHFQGQGWKTASTAASQPVDWRAYVLPVQNTTNPFSEMHFDAAVNGGSYTNVFKADSFGTFTVGTINTFAFATATNCTQNGTAASPSVVSCGTAVSGAFSCATNASTATCVVNTSTVTANSNIFIQPSAAYSTRLSVTCNSSSDTGLTSPRLASISTGTSFTLNLGTFITNPLCFDFLIVN